MVKPLTVNQENAGSSPASVAIPGGTFTIWVEGPGFLNIVVDDQALAYHANAFNESLDEYERRMKCQNFPGNTERGNSPGPEIGYK